MGQQDERAEQQGFPLASIQADIDGLADFRAFLGRELDANLRPGTQEVLSHHEMGARFGVGYPTSGTTAARDSYSNLLDASTRNLRALVQIADVLIDAMAAVMESLRDADGAAGKAMKTILDKGEGVDRMTAGVQVALPMQTVSASDPKVETTHEDHRQYAGTGHVNQPPSGA